MVRTRNVNIPVNNIILAFKVKCPYGKVEERKKVVGFSSVESPHPLIKISGPEHVLQVRPTCSSV